MSKVRGSIGRIIKTATVAMLLLVVLITILCLSLCSKELVYYVEYAGEKYESGESGIVSVFPDSSYKFFVKSSEGAEVDYSVKIESNKDNNFSFTKNGKICWLWNNDEIKDDYSEIFGLDIKTDGFTITLLKSFTVKTAIEKKYGEEIELKGEWPKDLCFFEIIVSTENEPIIFHILCKTIEVIIDPPSIII